MSSDFIELLMKSSKVSDSEKWDAEYETLPVVIAESAAYLEDALLKLDEVVSAYETYPEVEEKYNKIVEAESGRGNAATGVTFDPPEGSSPVSLGQNN